MKLFTLLTSISLITTQLVYGQDERAPGDIIVADDLSEPANWITYTEDSTEPQWDIVLTTPENISTIYV